MPEKEYEREGPCQGFSQDACVGVEEQASPQTGSWQPGGGRKKGGPTRF